MMVLLDIFGLLVQLITLWWLVWLPSVCKALRVMNHSASFYVICLQYAESLLFMGQIMD